MMLAPWVTSHCGERSGWWFSPYDGGMDEHTWSLMIGWGGRAIPPPRPGYLDPLYRFSVRIEWRPLATCFEWWCEYLGVEYQWHHRGSVHTRILCGVRKQYRIHSFRRWPVAVRFLSALKNVYDEHKLCDGDRFWRCDHGLTGFADGFVFTGCRRCAIWRPLKAARLALSKGTVVLWQSK